MVIRSDPNIQQLQNGTNMACQGQLNILITKEWVVGKWHVCKLMQKYFLKGLNGKWVESDISNCVRGGRDLRNVDTKQCIIQTFTCSFTYDFLLPSFQSVARLCYGPMFPFILCCSINSTSVTLSTVVPTQGLIWLGKHFSLHPVVTDRCSGIVVFLCPYMNHITGTWWYTCCTNQPSWPPPFHPSSSIMYSKWWWNVWVAWKSAFLKRKKNTSAYKQGWTTFPFNSMTTRLKHTLVNPLCLI